jgi:hypothetical protein
MNTLKIVKMKNIRISKMFKSKKIVNKNVQNLKKMFKIRKSSKIEKCSDLKT